MRSALVLATVLAACAGVAVGIVGCLGKPRFECAGNGDCVNGAMQGTCQPSGCCSFPDPACPSGESFGDLCRPEGTANGCVPLMIDAPPADAAIDAYVHDARECFGGGGAYMLCFDMMPPMGDVNLSGTLNTDTDARCMEPPASWTTAGQPAGCMILGKTITVASTAVTGGKVLLVVGDTITITGTLDVSSKRTGALGPGAMTTTQCAPFASAPIADPQGGGGGAGGSFATRAGNGGRGASGGITGGVAAPQISTPPTVLRAGCPGQAGAAGGAATAPGFGGGAVFLTASKITIAGAINASGAGALGGATAMAGGSGGGSGGMIVLHAAETITANGARLVANGGGGSSGASNSPGAPGDDPNPASPSNPADGGSGGGSSGGDGFALGESAEDGANGNNNRGGGGGGGGGGYIQSNKALTGATASPAATIVP